MRASLFFFSKLLTTKIDLQCTFVANLVKTVFDRYWPFDLVTVFWKIRLMYSIFKNNIAYKFYVNKYVFFKQESLLSEINHYREPKPEYEQLDIMDGISKI